MILKLHFTSNTITYVNTDNICYICDDDPIRTTSIYFLSNDCIHVTETPDEIVKMWEGENNVD